MGTISVRNVYIPERKPKPDEWCEHGNHKDEPCYQCNPLDPDESCPRCHERWEWCECGPDQPAVVVTRSGLQSLLPGCEPPAIVKGETTQTSMF